MTESEVATAIATAAAEMCLQMAYALHRTGVLPDEVAVEVAKPLREIAKLYERAGVDEFAATYWSAARRLDPGGPSPG